MPDDDVFGFAQREREAEALTEPSTDPGNVRTVAIHASPGTFPLPELIETGAWAALTPGARALLGVLWDEHRKHPDACHPSRERLARLAGLSPPTVTRCLPELQSIGIVSVHSSPPNANTYRVRWDALRLPAAEPPAKASSSTRPYKRPTRDATVTLLEDGSTNYSRHVPRNVHHMPDGCHVRSASEVAVHAWLTAWKVPHLANVPYAHLGIRGLPASSSADFWIAPRLLVEYFGAPRTQSQAARYNAKRKAKRYACKAAGWTLIELEAGQTTLTEEHCTILLDAWATCTIPEAEALRARWELADVPGRHFAVFALDAHIQDAREREAGTKPPADPTPLYGTRPGRNGMPVTVRQTPRIILCSAAGRATGPDMSLINDLLD